MIQDVVSFSDSLCSGKCVRCRIILPLYYFPVSVCQSRSAAAQRRCLLSLTGAPGPRSLLAAGSSAQLCPAPRPRPKPQHPCPGDLFLLTLGSAVQVTVMPAGGSDGRGVPWHWGCPSKPAPLHPVDTPSSCCPAASLVTSCPDPSAVQ